MDIKKIGSFLKELHGHILNDEVFGLSAQLAYFFLLSLFPFLIFLVTLVGYLPISEESVLSFIRQYAPGETMNLIETNVMNILENQRGDLLSFGIIGTIWSASNGLNAIFRAFNRAYEVNENRSFIITRLMAIFLTIAMIFVIIVALSLPVFGKAIGLFVAKYFGVSATFLTIWNTIRWVFSFIILMIVFTFLYYLAPNKKLKLREVIVGAAFATIGWQVVSFGFSFYVNQFGNFSAMYGSIGAIIILMIWFYMSGIIIIIGGEINALAKKYREV